MKLTKHINSLGQDVDLVTRSDSWLEKQYNDLLSEYLELTQQIRSIELAKKIKEVLRKRNLVATASYNGETSTISIKKKK